MRDYLAAVYKRWFKLPAHFYSDGTPMSDGDERWFNVLGDVYYVGAILVALTLVYVVVLLVTGA